MDESDVAAEYMAAEVAAATEAVQTARDFIAVYAVADQEPCGIEFYGRPTGLLDKLEEKGVDLDSGRYGRTWVNDAGNRQFHINHNDQEIRAQLEKMIIEVAAR